MVRAKPDFPVREVHRVVRHPHIFAQRCGDGLFAVEEELFEDVVFLSQSCISNCLAFVIHRLRRRMDRHTCKYLVNE